MLDEICGEIRNYFERNAYRGTFTIKDGVLSPSDFLKEGQYFRIIGSVFNDGVYQYPHDIFTDEIFVGEVRSMAVPPAVIDLAEEIKKYAQSDAAKPSPYSSESFGGYSYSKPVDANGVSSNSWQKVFAKQLNRWRKI